MLVLNTINNTPRWMRWQFRRCSNKLNSAWWQLRPWASWTGRPCISGWVRSRQLWRWLWKCSRQSHTLVGIGYGVFWIFVLVVVIITVAEVGFVYHSGSRSVHHPGGIWGGMMRTHKHATITKQCKQWMHSQYKAKGYFPQCKTIPYPTMQNNGISHNAKHRAILVINYMPPVEDCQIELKQQVIVSKGYSQIHVSPFCSISRCSRKKHKLIQNIGPFRFCVGKLYTITSIANAPLTSMPKNIIGSAK